MRSWPCDISSTSSTFTAAALAAHACRPNALGLAVHTWNAWRTALVIVKPETVLAWHRQGFRLFWTWKSRRRVGDRPCPGRPPVDSNDGGDESAVGRATDSRRALETGDRRLSGDRREVHAADDTALTDVAHVSRESRRANRGRRLLRRADRHVPTLVRAGHPRASSAAASCTWRSPAIPRPRGRPNNSARRFRRTRPLDISFTIAITPSRGRPRRPRSASRRCSPRLGRRGRRTTLHTAPHWADRRGRYRTGDQTDVGPAF